MQERLQARSVPPLAAARDGGKHRGRGFARIRAPFRSGVPVARSRSKLHQVSELDIAGLTQDGRGVGHREDGKTVFVTGALPGERVRAEQTGRNRHFDEAKTLDVLTASPD